MALTTQIFTDNPNSPEKGPLRSRLVDFPSRSSDVQVTCVDLDGTLIAGDVFWESVFRLLRRKPWLCASLFLWILRGKAYAKQRVAVEVVLDVEALPYRLDVVDFLRQSQARGRTLALVTAADERVADAVASHLGLFTHVIASDGHVNLSGTRKAARLEAEFGRGQFEYLGNDWTDVPVWRSSGAAVAVAAPKRLVKSMQSSGGIRELVPGRPKLASIVRALRPHQWSKNLLIFAPLIAAHAFLQTQVLIAALVVFVAFSFCASAGYVINDLVDIEADRLHPRKKERPFAAGHLSIPLGVAMAVTLLLAGLTLAAQVSGPTLALLGAYLVMTFSYSAWLKREPVADVFVLAGLYVLRVVVGGIATGIPLSTWLLAFALFLFLSLAFVKRYTELSEVGRAPGRGYTSDDRAWVQSVGAGCGYMATLVLALYVTAPDVSALYRRPTVLFLLCPLMLFWITRMWFKAGRGSIHHDPVVETLTDPVGYVCCLAGAIVLFLAI